MLVGAILLAVALARTLRGHYSPQHHMGVELSGIYWHFVDVVWVVLYTLVYLLSNGARAPLVAGARGQSGAALPRKAASSERPR